MKTQNLKKSRILAPKAKAKMNPAEIVNLEVVKQLTVALGGHGITVRREELKRGPGWRAVSGMCRTREQRMLFLDRHMPHEDQIAFLTSKIAELKLELSPDCIGRLPERVRLLLAA